MSNNNNTSRKRRYYSDKIIKIYHEVHGFPETNSSQFIPTTRIGFYQDFLDALDNFDTEPAIPSLSTYAEEYPNESTAYRAYNRGEIHEGQLRAILDDLRKKKHLRARIIEFRNELAAAPEGDFDIVREIVEEGANYEPQILTQAMPNFNYNFGNNGTAAASSGAAANNGFPLSQLAQRAPTPNGYRSPSVNRRGRNAPGAPARVRLHSYNFGAAASPGPSMDPRTSFQNILESAAAAGPNNNNQSVNMLPENENAAVSPNTSNNSNSSNNSENENPRPPKKGRFAPGVGGKRKTRKLMKRKTRKTHHKRKTQHRRRAHYPPQ